MTCPHSSLNLLCLGLAVIVLATNWRSSALATAGANNPSSSSLPEDTFDAFHVKAVVSSASSSNGQQAARYGRDVPQGKSSLAFVFDITGSMYDDLVQVRDGAKRIFAMVMEQRHSFIYNYILVPFHDPDVGPVVATSDTEFFQRKLQNMYVQGGGDCPEMCITGIKMALQAALPNSFVYVFTDARAKDYHLAPEVLNLIQEKQSQVVFVMTGDCGNRTHPGYTVFEEIASTSNGQVFHLEKSDVNEVLNYVKISVQTRKVYISSLDRAAGGTQETTIPVDGSLLEFTVSVSGDFPELELLNPNGQVVSEANGLKQLISLGNVLVVNLNNPMPGVWRVRSTARNRHSVRVTGIGQIDFNYGFSTRRIDNISKTHLRPVAGIQTQLYVNMSGLGTPGKARHLELIDILGHQIHSCQLSLVKASNPHLYKCDSLIPPAGFYFVKVSGIDDSGNQFQRISPTAVSAQAPTGPRIYAAAKTTAFLGKSTNITCEVVSRAPFSLFWYKNDDRIGGPITFKHSDAVTLSIPNVSESTSGRYTCTVVSTTGNASAATDLEAMDPPPEIIAPASLSVSAHQPAFLHCRTQTQGRITVQWRKNNASLPRSHNLVEYSNNGTLKIVNVSKSDEAIYTCSVTNPAGTVTADILLKVLDLPKVSVEPKSFYFADKGDFNISCASSGSPRPQVQWFHNDQRIYPNERFYITYKHDLIVRSAAPSDQGQYECRASSAVGTATDSATALLSVPPRIQVTPNNLVVGRYEATAFHCKAITGQPPPKVTWFKGGREVTNFAYVTVLDGKLHIAATQQSDAGVYTCVGENIAGRVESQVTLDVGSAPVILPSPETVTVNVERDATLYCRTTGYPKPEISWTTRGQPVNNIPRFRVQPDGALHISGIQMPSQSDMELAPYRTFATELSDAGQYVCTAVNKFGRQESIKMLAVGGLIAPVLSPVASEEAILEGTSARLSCIVIMGTPKPVIAWLKDGQPIESSRGNHMIESDGSGLMIRSASAADEGDYTCFAKNVAGNASLDVRVQIIARPKIEAHPQEIVANEGSRVELLCRASGKPQPIVSWTKDGRTLYLSAARHSLQPSGNLEIFQASRADAGTYQCKAINSVGETARNLRLTVLTLPSILPSETQYSAKEGSRVSLVCQVTGDPQPTILWSFRGRPIVDSRSQRLDHDGSLTIFTAKENNSGEYKCQAQNSVGKAERIVNLKVHVSPKIEGAGEVKQITVRVNDSVTLPCSAQADPPPHRKWTFEQRSISPFGSELRFLGDGSLQITSAQAKHSGSYVCFVSNVAGNDSIIYNLQVTEPPKIISDIPGTIDVVLGLRLEIPCRAIGKPLPTITWEKNSLQLLPDREFSIDSDGTIRIENAVLAHAGRYVCTAKNTAGSDIRYTNVVVQEPPTILPQTVTELTTIEGRTAEFICLAKGSPAPKIQWFRHGQLIDQRDPSIRISNEKLLLLSAKKSDHGPITCKATNPAGTASKDIRLTVIVPPDISDQQTVAQEEVVVGGTFSLYCPVLSHPIPEITWQLNNRPLVESDPNIRLSDDRRKVHILAATVVDSGIYKCTARNAAGESTKTFHVDVVVPPNLDESKHKRKLSVILNQDVTIGCPVKGTDLKIVWLIQGQLMENGNAQTSQRGIRLSQDNKQVLIQAAQRDHEGTYTCVASNKAGTLDVDVSLTVLVPPELGEDQTVNVIEGHTVTLGCHPKDSGVADSVIWHKDGQPATHSASNVQTSTESRKVFIKRIRQENAGTYSCTVRNSAGETRKHYHVVVLVPPKFRAADYQSSVTIAAGNAFTLSCDIDGRPMPQVSWTKNGISLKEISSTNIRLLDSNQRLSISRAVSENGNGQGGTSTYTCTAANDAGSVSRDFFVRIIDPPLIDRASERQLVEAIKGSGTVLNCTQKHQTTSWSKEVEVVWFKNGQLVKETSQSQVALDKSRLHLLRLDAPDEGIYVCKAKNLAGESAKEFQVVVLYPPAITGKAIDEVEVIETHPVHLRCEAEAKPPAAVEWTKDGSRTLPATAKVTADKATLYLEQTQRQDAGRYVCVVANKVGSAEKVFSVKVLIPPRISGADAEEQAEVQMGHSITLDCPTLDLTPDLETEWFKNDRTAAAATQQAIASGNRHYYIPNAKPEDAGRYSCVVKNKAGTATKRIRLNVLVPPQIRSEGGAYSIPVNHSINLDCDAEGFPSPKLEWTRASVAVASTANAQILSGGQQLQITRVRPDHHGRYLCTATNKVGSASIAYDLEVILPPVVSANVKDTITSIQNQTATIRCPIIDTKSSGRITWLKNRSPIDEKLNREKYQLSQRGRILLILNSQVDDEGSYACVVKNRAGETTVGFRLTINIPPTIHILEKDKNQTTVEHNSVTLSCPVLGTPEPVVTWYKDGKRLNHSIITDVIPSAAIIGSQLRIARVRTEDAGRFTCAAVNDAGTSEQDISLFVMTPPKIERDGIADTIRAVLDARAVISCPALGKPLPEVTWLKAGRPIAQDSAGRIYASAGGQKLYFVKVGEEDLARYTCIARNAAGEDKRDFAFEVLVSPSILGPNIPRSIQVDAGRIATLDCPAAGTPEPNIAWLKNGQPISESARLRFLSSGRQLQISDVTEDDTDRYTCIASNTIGVADLDFFLNIIGPPRIDDGIELEEVEVIESTSATLECRISGSEPLEISWLKDGQAISFATSTHYLQTASKGQVLHILAAQALDEGRYECVGRNRAGEARKAFAVSIQVAPVIDEAQSSPSVLKFVKGAALKIDCTVQGKPFPEISWFKDGKETLNEKSQGIRFANNNQTLLLSAMEESHGGRYTCHVINRAGVVEKDFTLQLRAPPQVDQAVVRKEAKLGDYVLLTCGITSDSSLQIQWLVDGRPATPESLLSNVKIEDKRVEIKDALLSDSGRYTCVGKNEAGEARKHFDLVVFDPPRFLAANGFIPSIVVDRPLELDCSVAGNPKPTIAWYKDGLRIRTADIEENVLNEGQTLRIPAASFENRGRYTCIAENQAGRAEKDLIVDVLAAPEILQTKTNIEVPENDSISIECPVNMQSAIVEWSKNGNSFISSKDVQISANGRKLHLLRTQPSHAGRYTCTASNEAGDASLNFAVVVLVAPRIHGEGLRNLQAVVNQSITVECRAAGIPEPKIEWLHNGQPLLGISNRIDILNNGSMLRLYRIQATQEGRYTCTARNKIAKDDADTFLQVLTPPTIQETEAAVKVVINQAHTIRCDVQAEPPPTVEWLKNGHPFSSALIHAGPRNHYIHFPQAQPSDKGRYTCIAKNRAGEDRFNVNMEVLVPPVIIADERILNVIENQSLIILCPASGTPEPIVTWLKNGQSATSDYTITGNRLVIASAKTDDAAKFSCEARNEAGLAEADFIVDVFVKPHFVNLDTNVNVIEGQKATLNCSVEAKPAAEIVWLRGGRPLDLTSTNFVLSPLGNKLMILATKRTDAGSYSCVARNAAGEAESSFTVSVGVAPHIATQVDQNPKAVVGKDIRLECPAAGSPKPEITWLKDSEPLQIIAGGRFFYSTDNILLIKNASVADRGRYTCRAHNAAGDLETDFVVDIIAPPKIGISGPTELEFTKGLPIVLDCNVEALPVPEIKWKKGDTEIRTNDKIWLSADGKKLTISDATIKDAGSYTCTATNVAGSTSLSLLVHVNAPPEIDTSNIIGEPLGIVGKSITLECPVSAVPPPSVAWLKDNLSLSSSDQRISYSKDNQTLKIDAIEIDDAGRYTCVAENRAGRKDQDFVLEVLTPPKLDQTGQAAITAAQAGNLTLTCPLDVSANIQAEISWTKQGRPIDAASQTHLKISSDGRTLYISNVKIADAGLYSCVASNRAGESHLEYDVDVQSLPEIDSSKIEPTPHVRQGEPLTLWCAVRSQPPPTIKWFKDAIEIDRFDENSNYEFLDDNQGLKILEATPEDAGRYMCLAANSVGTQNVSFIVDVWVAPTVNINGSKAGSVGEPAELICLVTGNPEPSVQWTKNGDVIISSAPDGPQVSLDQRRINIPALRERDIGRYTCTAKNEAGTSAASKDLDVFVAPIIRKDNVDLHPRLQTGQTLTLACEANGKPMPTVLWKKDNVVIDENSIENIDTLSNGAFLQIHDIQAANRGVYRCEASNRVGTDHLEITVSLVEAPTISPEESFKVIEGDAVQMICNARGIPEPEVIWHRNGQRVSTRERYTILDNNLRILATRSNDAGIYVCIASNEFGIAQQAYSLEVIVKPKIIERSPRVTTVPQGQTFKLLCVSRGYPEPERKWFKEGNPIRRRDRLTVDKEGSLIVLNAQPFDTGVYKCLVSNDAGQAEEDYEVQVIEPPRVADDHVEMSVNQGEPVVMRCEALGSPAPTVSWTKNGASIVASSTVTFPEQHILKLTTRTLLDAGNYTCVAQNIAGSSRKFIRLNILVPPSISDSPAVLDAVEGSRVELICDAIGVPDPAITWTTKADGESTYEPVPEIYRRGSAIVFPAVKRSDAADYNCTAHNSAGSVSQITILVVLQSPSIKPERQNLTANESSTFELHCNATASPEPTIQWYIEPSTRIEASDKYEFIGTSLRIHDVRESDENFYRCVATNKAGVNVAFRKLNVLGKRRLPRVLWVECEDGEPISKTTFVRQRGPALDSDEEHSFSWRDEEMIDLPANGTNGVLIKCLPEHEKSQQSRTRVDDMMDEEDFVGHLRAPVLTTTPKSQSVHRREPIVMRCGAMGTPTPGIEWFHNHTMIKGRTITKNNNGESTLRIASAAWKHAGTYACVAMNEVGSARSPDAIVRIQGGKAYQAESPVSAERRLVTLFSCKTASTAASDAAQHKRSDVDWFLNGQLMDANELEALGAQLLANGSLAISSEATSWESFKCKVKGVDGHLFAAEHSVQESEPRVYIEPHKKVVSAGENAFFTCNHGASLLTTRIEWMLNGTKIHTADKFKVFANNKLQINDVGASEAGFYECVASNAAGRDSDTGLLIVESTGYWSEWTEWTECSSTCAPASRGRNRQCLGVLSSKSIENWHCLGEAIEMEPCRDLPECTRIYVGGNHNRHLQTALKDQGSNSLSAESFARPSIAYGWTSWSSWSSCSKSCEGGTRNRMRYCHTPLSTTSFAEFCQGMASELEACNADRSCSDGYPEGLSGTIRGNINDVQIEPTPIWGEVMPQADNNEIFYKIQSLPLELGSVNRAMVGLVTAPCWAFSHPSSPAKNGYSVTKGRYNQSSNYRFGTGENLMVKQEAKGLDPQGFMTVDILISGSTPNFARQQIITMDPFTENYVQAGDGHIKGSGQSTIKVGAQYRMPLEWQHNIRYDADEKLGLPAQHVSVAALDLTTDNSLTDKNFGYHLKAAAFGDSECPPGFAHKGNEFCDDVNECRFPFACRQRCVNTIGSYRCECAAGFRRGKRHSGCLDVDECARGTHNCSSSQACENTQGAYRCMGVCEKGFQAAANGTCIDIDECTLGIAQCTADQQCVNTEGSYSCVESCRIGYRRRDDGVCIDIDECFEHIPCQPSQLCHNTQGSYRCSCPSGFVESEINGVCEDIDECVLFDYCSHGCHNNLGSFICDCPFGMELIDRRNCMEVTIIDIDSGETSAELKNPCLPGFQWNGDDCEDIDECLLSKCQYSCVNTEGGFQCECPFGYELDEDQRTCQDIDECVTGDVQCQQDDLCFNIFHPKTRKCLLECRITGKCSEREESELSTHIQIQVVALPYGLPAGQDILRLIAYDRNGRHLRRTKFAVKGQRADVPFTVRLENGRGVVYATEALYSRRSYRLRVKATSFSDWSHSVRYHTEFLVFISVSEFPF